MIGVCADSMLVKGYDHINLAFLAIHVLLLLTMLDNVVGNQAWGPLLIHSVLQLRIIDHGRRFSEFQSLAAQLKLLFASSAQSLCIAI